jgi:hypothetical protein
MTNPEQLSRPKPGPRLTIAGAALIGAGSIIGLAGVAIETVALIRAGRWRIEHMEVPPRQLAKRQWTQSKAAWTAGAAAWRDGRANQPVH